MTVMQFAWKWMKVYLWLAFFMFIAGFIYGFLQPKDDFKPGVASDEEKIQLKKDMKKYGQKNLLDIEMRHDGSEWFWNEEGIKCKIRR